MTAERFHIAHQMGGGVVGEIGFGHRAARAALIEQHNAIARGIKEAPVGGRRARARSAMHEDDRQAFRIARLLPIHAMGRADIEHARSGGIDGRKQRPFVAAFEKLARGPYALIRR